MLKHHNHAPGATVRTIRETMHGSDWYGSCEICNKPASTIYASKVQTAFLRPDGTTGLYQNSGSSYGHLDCLESANA
jgi:hypothetical protein